MSQDDGTPWPNRANKSRVQRRRVFSFKTSPIRSRRTYDPDHDPPAPAQGPCSPSSRSPSSPTTTNPPMEARTIFNLLEIATSSTRAQRASPDRHLDLPAQRQLGVGLQIAPAAILPDGVLALGRLAGFWLGNLTAVDNTLFRDKSGKCHASGPVKGQCASLYIPFAAAQERESASTPCP